MILLRKILFPFAILYGWITQFRNFLFDKNILKSFAFDLPIIAVGNLSVGGTGKTPQIEYLIRLLSQDYNIATLSRGYKRKSEGFILADEDANAEMLGDEPYQFYQKFPNIDVAVDADRKNGIEQLLFRHEKPQVILLDDAFQHRKVKAGFYILLTAYGDLYVDDFMLPTGNLREGKYGAKRADLIIVTKCPASISEAEQHGIRKKLNLDKPVFFSTIAYDEAVYSEGTSVKIEEIKGVPKLLVAGIAKPKSFFAYLQTESDKVMTFSDHHHFTEKDITGIKQRAGAQPIVTTEKDYVRLKGLIKENLYYLPIKTSFINDKEKFDKTILHYVGKSRADR